MAANGLALNCSCLSNCGNLLLAISLLFVPCESVHARSTESHKLHLLALQLSLSFGLRHFSAFLLCLALFGLLLLLFV